MAGVIEGNWNIPALPATSRATSLCEHWPTHLSKNITWHPRHRDLDLHGRTFCQTVRRIGLWLPLTHDIAFLLECLPQAWTASSPSPLHPAPSSHNTDIDLLVNHTRWLPHTFPQQQPRQGQQHQHDELKPAPSPLSLSSPTCPEYTAPNFLMQQNN
jgi:hypothetical protein